MKIAAPGHEYGELIAKKDATCTEDGMKAHYKCSACGTFFDEDKNETTEEALKIAALGHKLEKIDRVEPTYEAAGTEEYWVCSVCEKMFSDENGANEITEPQTIDKLQPTKATPTFKLSATKYVYSGQVKKPGVTVTVNGKALTTEDYTVTYDKGRKLVGEYKVTVTLKHAYEGKATKSFKIVPKKPVISKATPGVKKLTVKMKTTVSKTGGKMYQIAYKVKGTKTWKKTTTSKQSKVIKKLKTNKQYQVKVRAYKTVNKTKYYGAWSKIKTTKKIK